MLSNFRQPSLPARIAYELGLTTPRTPAPCSPMGDHPHEHISLGRGKACDVYSDRSAPLAALTARPQIQAALDSRRNIVSMDKIARLTESGNEEKPYAFV
jgi:hypothetical protein